MIVNLNSLTGLFYGQHNPINENIEIDLSNAVVGGLACVFHSGATVPSINGASFVLSGSFKQNSLNLIWITYLGNNKALVSYQVGVFQLEPVELTPITFISGPNNLLTNPISGQYGALSGTNYAAYGNSDFKFPANELSYIEVDVPNMNFNNVMLGLATSNVAGNWTQTKFNFTIFKSTTAPKFITQLNGVLLNSNAGSYYYGATAKVRLQREADGTCKIFKSANGIDFELAFTYPELYTGEMYFVTSIFNNQAFLINPKGFNVIAK